MRTRTIVGITAIPLFILLIFFAPLWAFAIAVGLISAGSAWEFLRCVDPNMPVRLRAYASASAFLIPLVYAFAQKGAVTIISTTVYFLAVLMFMEIMLSYRKDERIKTQTLLQVIFAGAVMPLLLSSLVRIGLRSNSSVYVFLPLVAAFSSDSGAYFAGSFLGKRKIFPHLSPNKSLEGCIGGVLSAIAMMLVYGAVLTALSYNVNFFLLVLYGLFGSAACQFGDLAFSAVKREYGIKDYGKLIPGHGGMRDRFDSMHFTAPMMELLVLLLPAIS
ncbi:MAG: phosphatidate cytidylyltransferase [Clostridiales bacterium]|nr:phosphatidate cytidylyltransferase [Clostridiales bacterium]